MEASRNYAHFLFRGRVRKEPQPSAAWIRSEARSWAGAASLRGTVFFEILQAGHTCAVPSRSPSMPRRSCMPRTKAQCQYLSAHERTPKAVVMAGYSISPKPAGPFPLDMS